MNPREPKVGRNGATCTHIASADNQSINQSLLLNRNTLDMGLAGRAGQASQSTYYLSIFFPQRNAMQVSAQHVSPCLHAFVKKFKPLVFVAVPLYLFFFFSRLFYPLLQCSFDGLSSNKKLLLHTYACQKRPPVNLPYTLIGTLIGLLV